MSIFHAQSNTVERFHKDLGNFLRAFSTTTLEWDELIQWAAFQHNTAKNYSGFSPFELAFGRKISLPQDDSRIYTYDDYASDLRIIMQKARQIANANEQEMRQKNKMIYDKNAKQLDLKVGDLVFRKNVLVGEGRKLQEKFSGPHKVLKILNDFNVLIRQKNKQIVVHKNLLKKHCLDVNKCC